MSLQRGGVVCGGGERKRRVKNVAAQILNEPAAANISVRASGSDPRKRAERPSGAAEDRNLIVLLHVTRLIVHANQINI